MTEADSAIKEDPKNVKFSTAVDNNDAHNVFHSPTADCIRLLERFYPGQGVKSINKGNKQEIGKK